MVRLDCRQSSPSEEYHLAKNEMQEIARRISKGDRDLERWLLLAMLFGSAQRWARVSLN